MSERKESPEWVNILPHYFAAAAAIIYGAGFLVEFHFANSLGIRGGGTDPFKAKYIYLGVLCLLFPATIGTSVLGYIRLARYRRRSSPSDVISRTIRFLKDKTEWAYWAGILTILNTVFVFYFVVTFSDPGFFRHNQGPIAFIVCGSPFLTVLLRLCEGRGPTWVTVGFRWLFLVVAGLLTWSILSKGGALALLREVLYEGGWVYIALLITIGILIWWLEKNPAHSKTELVISICLQAAFAYLSVLWFAYRIYPYIPVERGGGDYSREPNAAILSFDPEVVKSIPDEIRSDFTSYPLIILDETGTALFVTRPESQTNAKQFETVAKSENISVLQAELRQWRLPGRENKPKRIVAVKRDSIISINFTRD